MTDTLVKLALGVMGRLRPAITMSTTRGCSAWKRPIG